MVVAVSHFIVAFMPELLYIYYPIEPSNRQFGLYIDVLTSPLISIFYNGRFAVYVFFVLSGYVLTKTYFDANTTSELKKRIVGRYFRLNVPVASILIVSYIVYALNLYADINSLKSSEFGILLNKYFKDIAFIEVIKAAGFKTIILGENILNPPTWTIKVEFVGSIYLLLFYIFQNRIASIKYYVPLLGAVLVYFYEYSSLHYFALFLGSLINIIKPSKTLMIILIITGGFLASYQLNSYVYSFLPSLSIIGLNPLFDIEVYCLCGSFLLVLPIANGYGRKFWELKSIQYLAKISFSLYLIHFIVLCSLSCYLYLYFPKNGIYILLNLMIYVLDCVFLASLFFKYIDMPSIQFSKTISSYVISKFIQVKSGK